MNNRQPKQKEPSNFRLTKAGLKRERSDVKAEGFNELGTLFCTEVVKGGKDSSSFGLVRFGCWEYIRSVAIIVLMLIAVFGSAMMAGRMYENLRWWSTRSLVQKETSFYSEQAMYYRYAKKASNLPDLLSVMNFFTNDTKIQYPEHINALTSFNVYPELFVGLFHRFFGGNTPIIDFYVDSCRYLNGLLFGFVLLISIKVSGTMWGGLPCAVVWVFSFEQITRSWHSPALRESWAIPFWFAGIWCLTLLLTREDKNSHRREKRAKNYVKAQINSGAKNYQGGSEEEVHLKHAYINAEFEKEGTFAGFVSFIPSAVADKFYLSALYLSTLCFAMSWQFAQFTLFTQIFAILLLYLLSYIGLKLCLQIHFAYFLVTVSMIGLQPGNLMLLNSLLFNYFIVALPLLVGLNRNILAGKVLFNESRLHYFTRLIRAAVFVASVLAITLVVKSWNAKLFDIDDDGHIFDILKAKFTSFSTFDTKLYLKQEEYQVVRIDGETVKEGMRSLILPFSLFVAALLFVKFLFFTKPSNQLSAVTMYHWLQYMACLLMTILIMRLKVHLGPFYCILISLFVGKEARKLSKWFHVDVLGMTNGKSRSRWTHILIVFWVTASLTYVGYEPWAKKMNEEFEWNHEELQEVVQWIDKNTPTDSVFVSEMVLTSIVSLYADRTVTNHPHYESVGIRAKTRDVYKMYYCVGEKEMWKIFKRVSGGKVNYLLLAEGACSKSSSLFTEEEAQTCAHEDKFCAHLLWQDDYKNYFHRVYKNKAYSVYKIV